MRRRGVGKARRAFGERRYSGMRWKICISTTLFQEGSALEIDDGTEIRAAGFAANAFVGTNSRGTQAANGGEQ